jgi:uncharacterized protein YceH (UPF0502 family)
MDAISLARRAALRQGGEMDAPTADAPSPPAPLSPLQARILGCLLEKQRTTPEQYPLSLNGLVLAVNQRSNRDPVMEVGETAVQQALDDLRYTHRLVTLLREAGARVPKFQHELERRVTLDGAESALLCELLLRGPQTAAELRARAARLHPLADLAAVERALDDLQQRRPPLVARLPVQPGRREARFAHLLSGEPDEGVAAPLTIAIPPAVTADPQRVEALEARVVRLEEDGQALRAQLQELRQALGLSP